MNFEYPQFLYAFLLLLIPIIIHLFNFRRYKTLYFSSLQFVKQVNEETKSTQKLKHILILLARVLAFSALILAFAQPYKPLNTGFKGGKPFVGIYIDNSFSMSMKGSEGELLSMAKEKARELISKSSLDTRFMLVTNNFDGFEQHLVSKQEALERLDKIDYSPLVKSIGQVVSWMKSGISSDKVSNESLSSEQIILLSDFQKNSSGLSGLQKDDNTYFYPIQLQAQERVNLSIDSVFFEAPNFKVGQNNVLTILLHNYSEEAVEGVELQVEIGQLKRTITVSLKANEKTSIPFTYSDSKPGLKNGSVRINDKQMLFDDNYYFSYEVKEKSNVLIVDGEEAHPNVAKVYKLDTYYQISQKNKGGLTNQSVQNQDLVILNGWNTFSSGVVELLKNYVQNGGSLVYFPGTDIDFASVNDFLSNLQAPKFESTSTEGIKIQKITYEDIFFKGMFDTQPDKLNLPSQTKTYRTAQNKSYLPLILLQNNKPLFYKATANPAFYVFASSLDEKFGNFTNNALFSSSLLRVGELSQRRYPLALILGTDAAFPIYHEFSSENPIKLRLEQTEFIPETVQKNNTTYISLTSKHLSSSIEAGVYTLSKDDYQALMAINYNRTESNIMPLTSDEIKSQFSELGLKNVFYNAYVDSADGGLVKLEKPKEYWRFFLILALLFLLLEMALLKWYK